MSDTYLAIVDRPLGKMIKVGQSTQVETRLKQLAPEGSVKLVTTRPGGGIERERYVMTKLSAFRRPELIEYASGIRVASCSGNMRRIEWFDYSDQALTRAVRAMHEPIDGDVSLRCCPFCDKTEVCSVVERYCVRCGAAVLFQKWRDLPGRGVRADLPELPKCCGDYMRTQDDWASHVPAIDLQYRAGLSAVIEEEDETELADAQWAKVRTMEAAA